MKRNTFMKTVVCGVAFAFSAAGIFAQSEPQLNPKKIIKLEISNDDWSDEPVFFDSDEWYEEKWVDERNHPDMPKKHDGPEKIAKPGEPKKPGEPGRPGKFKKEIELDVVNGKIKIEGKKDREIVYLETRDGRRYVLTDFNFGKPHDERKAEKKPEPHDRKCSIHEIKRYKGKYITLRGILNRGSNVFTIIGIEPERKPASGWEK